MTILVLWQAVHTNKIASVYIGADSRISWSGSTGRTWDSAAKVFACSKHPEIFGYCGDVLFPTLMLSSLVMLIDRDSLIKSDMDINKKFEVIKEYFQQGLLSYPKEKLAQEFTIVYCTKSNRDFGFLELSSSANGLSAKELKPFERDGKLLSHHIEVYGSGKSLFIEKLENYQSKGFSNGNNIVEYGSPGVFLALCDTLEGEEPTVGGAPQLVGLYSHSKRGEIFGMSLNRKNYLMGKPIVADHIDSSIEWRNDRFENFDLKTGKPKKGAALNPRPKSVS